MGKTCHPDSNDEPANVLLKKITEEKEQLVKKEKINKQKSLPESGDDEKHFELPNGWAWGYIPKVVKNNKYAIKRGPFGSSIKKDFFVATGYKVYEQQHAINDDFSLGDYYIDDDKYNELKAFEVKPNDIIISCSGTVGRVAIAPSWMEPGIINQALLKLSLNENALINDYFKILFPAFYMKTETLSELQGTAQKNMVSVDTLKNESFPLPPLAEQHRIVAKVDELMGLCDLLEQQQSDSNAAHQTLVETLLNTLISAADQAELETAWQHIANHFYTLFTTGYSIDQLKHTILQLAVMGKLVPQNPENEPTSILLEKIISVKRRLIEEEGLRTTARNDIDAEEEYIGRPNGWAYCRLGNLAKFIDYRGKTPKKIESGIPLITAKNVRFGYISREPKEYISESEYRSWMTRGFPKVNDILFTTEAPLGNVALVNIEEKFALAQRIICFQLHEPSITFFLRILIMSSAFQDQLTDKSTGMTATGIKSAKLKELPVPLPPIAEQHRIVAKVDELFTICDALKEGLNAAQSTQIQLADAMVEQAMA